MITNFLLGLPAYYFLIAIVKTINIRWIKIKAELILNSQNFNQLDNIMNVKSGKVRLYSIYEHYTRCDLLFQKISIYKYV